VSVVAMDLVETLEGYRREVAPESGMDVPRFATFFHPMVNFTDELDMTTWIREQGLKRKKLKQRIKTAEKSASEERHTRLLKELSECGQPKPNQRRPIDEVAEEILFRLMAFKKLLTGKAPGRSISGHTGKRHGRFNRLALAVFELYGVEATPDAVLERLLRVESRDKTTESIDETIADYMAELTEPV
jgi:hypothetical protein